MPHRASTDTIYLTSGDNGKALERSIPNFVVSWNLKFLTVEAQGTRIPNAMDHGIVGRPRPRADTDLGQKPGGRKLECSRGRNAKAAEPRNTMSGEGSGGSFESGQRRDGKISLRAL